MSSNVFLQAMHFAVKLGLILSNECSNQRIATNFEVLAVVSSHQNICLWLPLMTFIRCVALITKFPLSFNNNINLHCTKWLWHKVEPSLQPSTEMIPSKS